MLCLSHLLSDETVATLREVSAGDGFPYRLLLNGRVECCYDTFQHAWDEFGKVLGCVTLNEALGVAAS
jgi:hypothetical protein